MIGGEHGREPAASEMTYTLFWASKQAMPTWFYGSAVRRPQPFPKIEARDGCCCLPVAAVRDRPQTAMGARGREHRTTDDGRVGMGNENRPFAGQTAVLTIMGEATVSFSAHNHNPRTPRRG